MVVGGSRPTFGKEGWQKMIMVLVAQGGGRSPSNVSRRGLAEFARAAHVRRGVAAGPSDVCREGLRSLGACLQGGAVFGGSFFKACYGPQWGKRAVSNDFTLRCGPQGGPSTPLRTPSLNFQPPHQILAN